MMFMMYFSLSCYLLWEFFLDFTWNFNGFFKRFMRLKSSEFQEPFSSWVNWGVRLKQSVEIQVMTEWQTQCFVSWALKKSCIFRAEEERNEAEPANDATCDFRPNVTLHFPLLSGLLLVLFVHELVSSCQVQRVLGQLIASHVCLTAPGTLYCLLCPTLVLLLSQEGEEDLDICRQRERRSQGREWTLCMQNKIEKDCLISFLLVLWTWQRLWNSIQYCSRIGKKSASGPENLNGGTK